MKKIIGFSVEDSSKNYSNILKYLERESLYLSKENHIHIVENLGQQAEAFRRLGRLTNSQSLFRKTYFIAKKTGISWAECWSLWGLGAVLRLRGAHYKSKLMFKAALTCSKLSNNKRCALWSYAELSELDRIAGRLMRSLSIHKMLRLEFVNIGDVKGVCWATLGIAQIYRLTRKLNDASKEFSIAFEESSFIGDSVRAAWALRGQAEVAKENGDISLASKLIVIARTMFLETGYKLGAAYALKTQADIILKEGKHSEAIDVAFRCKDEFVDCGERRGIGFSLLTLGACLSYLGEPLNAIAILDQSRLLIASSGGFNSDIFNPAIEIQRICNKYRITYNTLKNFCFNLSYSNPKPNANRYKGFILNPAIAGLRHNHVFPETESLREG